VTPNKAPVFFVSHGAPTFALAMDSYAWGMKPAHATQSAAAAEMTA